MTRFWTVTLPGGQTITVSRKGSSDPAYEVHVQAAVAECLCPNCRRLLAPIGDEPGVIAGACLPCHALWRVPGSHRQIAPQPGDSQP